MFDTNQKERLESLVKRADEAREKYKQSSTHNEQTEALLVLFEIDCYLEIELELIRQDVMAAYRSEHSLLNIIRE